MSKSKAQVPQQQPLQSMLDASSRDIVSRVCIEALKSIPEDVGEESRNWISTTIDSLEKDTGLCAVVSILSAAALIHTYIAPKFALAQLPTKEVMCPCITIEGKQLLQIAFYGEERCLAVVKNFALTTEGRAAEAKGTGPEWLAENVWDVPFVFTTDRQSQLLAIYTSDLDFDGVTNNPDISKYIALDL